MTDPAPQKTTKVLVISDTHNRHDALVMAPADILIHCGDFTMSGRESEVRAFDSWLAQISPNYKEIIVIAGNHDFMFQEDPEKARALLTHATYLEDSGTTALGLRIWGSPWTPQFYDWAFMLPRGEMMKAKRDLIPAGLDFLIVHGPPQGILDMTAEGVHAGCDELLAAVNLKQPRFCAFGHIHEGRGVLRGQPTTFVNACSVDERYQPSGKPILLKIPTID